MGKLKQMDLFIKILNSTISLDNSKYGNDSSDGIYTI